MNDTKIAVCLWGTFRGPKSSLPTLYEHIIKPYNADVFASLNSFYEDDVQRLSILKDCGTNIVSSEILKQEDLTNVFPKSFYEKLIPKAQEFLNRFNQFQINYLGPLVGSHTSLIIRLNWYRLSSLIEKHINNYDYFIITRPDHCYIFPLWDKSLMNNEVIVQYDAHRYGGVNADFVVVPRKFVLDWLRKSIDYLTNDTLQDIVLSEFVDKNIFQNSESYTSFITQQCGWNITTMNINSFISADSYDENTSCIGIKYSGTHYYKYIEQYEQCMKNRNLYYSGYKWSIDKDRNYVLTL